MIPTVRNTVRRRLLAFKGEECTWAPSLGGKKWSEMCDGCHTVRLVYTCWGVGGRRGGDNAEHMIPVIRHSKHNLWGKRLRSTTGDDLQHLKGEMLIYLTLRGDLWLVAWFISNIWKALWFLLCAGDNKVNFTQRERKCVYVCAHAWLVLLLLTK